VKSVLIGALAMMSLRSVSAQATATLYGSVRDSSSQPLRATLRVLHGDGVTVADAQGRFRLTVPASLVTVRLSFPGFRSLDDTVTLAAGDSLERDYRLGPVVTELQPVIVTAAKHSQLLSEAVTSVALVTDADGESDEPADGEVDEVADDEADERADDDADEVDAAGGAGEAGEAER